MSVTLYILIASVCLMSRDGEEIDYDMLSTFDISVAA